MKLDLYMYVITKYTVWFKLILTFAILHAVL